MKILRAYLICALAAVGLVSGCATEEEGQAYDKPNDWAHGTGDFLWDNVWHDGAGNPRSR